ncbi:hypothetical protein [Phytopseudomonas daroniae]|uniref:hypothetical protein n=1 Tax=Phytopseudomonas daroniae TaxID=2487519 RepID=UPI00103853E5|nr:hypothetical protein [Pseudomonas daroniae]TBU74081.1 hypothetical protein DNK10_15680 [Pseudomonas daroniae]
MAAKSWRDLSLSAFLLICVMFLLAICIGLVRGKGGSISWLEQIDVVNDKEWEGFQAAVISIPELVLEDYSASWQKTIFSPSRKLVVPRDLISDDPIESVEGLILSGVVIASDFKLAFLKQSDGRPLVAREGDYIVNGFLLEEVRANEIHINLDGVRKIMSVSSLRKHSED